VTDSFSRIVMREAASAGQTKRRKPAARKTAPGELRPGALLPMPDNPDVIPDPIQTGDYGDAQTVEERIDYVRKYRTRVIWQDVLALDADAGRRRHWCECMPAVYDPGHLLPAHRGTPWHSPHELLDFMPGPRGLQHAVHIRGDRFIGHGVEASVLPQPPPEVLAAREVRDARYGAMLAETDELAASGA